MRRYLRAFVEEWLIPPGVVTLLHRRSQRRSLEPTEAEAALLAQNAPLNGAYAGRRCFVICNGPSLANQDINPLGGEVTITMNWFNKHPVLGRWKPTFHCIAEPGERLAPGPINAMLEGLEAEGYFLQVEASQHFTDPLLRGRSDIHFVRSRQPAREWLATGASLDLTRTLPAQDETSQLALLVALAIGCTPIYLLGADQDWLSHRSIYRHFYPEENADEVEDMGLRRYDDDMRAALKVWESHRSLRELAERRGQKILNATEGGFMDVYPLVTLAGALGLEPRSPEVDSYLAS